MSNWSLNDYDHLKYGPLLGISDEGSAASEIMMASKKGAKKTANQHLEEQESGLIYDAERMTSAGEVPVGPEEYEQIINGSLNSLLYSTNVGVRVNARLYQPLPEFFISDARENMNLLVTKIKEVFAPFNNTINGIPRPLSIRLVLSPTDTESFDTLKGLKSRIDDLRTQGDLSTPEIHRISILTIFDKEITQQDDFDFIKQCIVKAAELKIRVIAIDGHKVEAARKRLSVQGILNVLDSGHAIKLLKFAQQHGVLLRYRYAVDVQSAARTIWTGLFSAKTNGLDAAKYGLVPLQFEDQRHVIEIIQKWMNDWTAVPAFYVDTPMLTNDDVYLSDRCQDALIKWLNMVNEKGVKTVLVDCPDRINPRIDTPGKETARRLIKLDENDETDRGVLTYSQIKDVVSHSKKIGVNILWSGGIRPQNAYELGKMEVAGIFTTSSTSIRIPVGNVLASDWQMASEVEPTSEGIQKVHSLLQAGFLSSKLKDSDKDLVKQLDDKAQILMNTERPFDQELDDLKSGLVTGWQLYWNQS